MANNCDEDEEDDAIDTVLNHSIAFGLIWIAICTFYLVIPSIPTGIFCGDTSINLPFKPSLIPSEMSFVIILLLAFFCFFIYECSLKKFRYQHVLIRIVPYGMGFTVTLLFTVFVKNRIGRPRPYFREFCDPYSVECYDNVTNELLADVYVEDFICRRTNYSTREWIESRKSFFSGHSSATAYGCIYLLLFIHHKLTGIPNVIRVLFQAFMFLGSLYFGYTRLEDNHHHPSDVYTGLAVGYFCGIFTYLKIVPRYEKYLDKRTREDEQQPQLDIKHRASLLTTTSADKT